MLVVVLPGFATAKNLSECPLLVQDAYPRGEIFLGHRGDGYAVQAGAPSGFKEMPFAFTVTTPNRKFVMGAESDRDRNEWIALLGKVMERPLTPQDTNSKARLGF